MARGWQHTKLSLSSVLLYIARVLRVCAMHPFYSMDSLLWSLYRTYLFSHLLLCTCFILFLLVFICVCFYFIANSYFFQHFCLFFYEYISIFG